MKTTKRIIAVLLVFAMLFGVTATAGAAWNSEYPNNSNFIKISSAQVNSKISNDDTFIVMLYLPSCINCHLIGENVVSKWMTDYNKKVYGVDLTSDSFPRFAVEKYGSSVSTPVIAFIEDGNVVNSFAGDTEYSTLNSAFYEFLSHESSYVKVQGIDITSSSKSFFLGQNFYLTAKLTPSNATIKAVEWSSSDESVASVNPSGRVFALKPGTAVITAKSADGGYTDTCTVTVSDLYVTSLVITRLPYKTVYQVGETHSNDGLLLEVTYSNGDVKTLNCGYSWFPPYMDTPGQKEVEVRYGGKSVYYYITVEGEAEPDTPDIPDEPDEPTYNNVTSVDIVVDRNFDSSYTAQLSVKLNPSDAEYKKIDWYSSDSCVASVSSNGLVTLNSCDGTATITVKVTNKDGSAVTDSVTVDNYSNGGDEDNTDTGIDDPNGDSSDTQTDGGLFSMFLNLFVSMFGFFSAFISLIFAFI